MIWVDFDGQLLEGYTSIGTDDYTLPITPGMDVQAAVEELKRCCGKLARIKLFREEEVAEDGDR